MCEAVRIQARKKAHAPAAAGLFANYLVLLIEPIN